jgi:hypothetical protein
MMLEKLYDWGYRWFLAPGRDWRTWLGHSTVVLLITWIGLWRGTHELGVSIVGFYFWSEILLQALPALIKGRKVKILDSWFDVFIPWVLFILSLGIYDRFIG